jgi:hypothetical protein
LFHPESFIGFSTSPSGISFDSFLNGNNTVDNKNQNENSPITVNSPYTTFLCKYISIPNLSIEKIFKKVRNDVIKITSGKQIPWEHSCLISEFSFL